MAGAAPIPQFLDGLGFSGDNLPNAAPVIETEAGATAIAVVELSNPDYDTASSTATDATSVLENINSTADTHFQETSASLDTVPASRSLQAIATVPPVSEVASRAS